MTANDNSFTSAYVIHTRPFQDNKILVDLLTAEYGLVRAVLRLSKKEVGRTPISFLQYQVLLKGRTDLKTIHLLESTENAINLEGVKLYAGMYVHELLLKLLPVNIPITRFFELYEWLIQNLETPAPTAPLLRRFEAALFDEIGSNINFSTTATGHDLDSTTLYRFDTHFGLRPYQGDKPKQLPVLFVEGRLALQYSQGEWQNPVVLKLAKELHRHWLHHLMEGKEIESRRLLPPYSYDGERLFGIPVFRSS